MSSLDGDRYAAALAVWLPCIRQGALHHMMLDFVSFLNDGSTDWRGVMLLTRDASGQGSSVQTACLKLCMGPA